MNFKKLTILAISSAFLFTSCNNDDDNTIITEPLGDYENGVLILNQGNFGTSNSSISFLSNDFSVFENNAFLAVNPNEELGDTAQDMGFYEDKAFVILNNSAIIQVLNRYTLQLIETIDAGLHNPRHIAFSNGKGYVTNWGDGGDPNDDYIAVINLSNYTVSTTIPVIEGPEKIIAHEGKLYVAHQGGYGYGESVSVITASNNQVSNTIEVGDVPNSLAIHNNILYVLNGGKPSWTGSETSGSLSKINLLNNDVTTLDFSSTVHPSNFVIANNKMYFTVDAAIYETSTSATTLPTTSIFSTTSQGVYGIYSFAVRNNKVYVGDAVDYNSNGKVYVYSLTGTLETQKTVGIIPTGFYFNN